MFKLPHVPTSDEVIDIAFRQGSKTAKAARSGRGPRERRMKDSEVRRIRVAGRKIGSVLMAIVKGFPSYDQLPEFHKRLLDIRIDKDRYKQSLGAVQWCAKNVERLKIESLQKGDSKAFLGRAASMVKKIDKDLDALIEIKNTLRTFPTIEDMPTLVVAGYPNVGKSTFMSNLTGSKVKIASYPFTTQTILIGHRMIRHQRYQIIDSPGLLDRPMEERNDIELQAMLAMKELADVILFLIDPGMETGPQMRLLKEVSGSFDSELYVAVNKADVTPGERLDEVLGELAGWRTFIISANDPKDCERVFEKIFRKKDDATSA